MDFRRFPLFVLKFFVLWGPQETGRKGRESDAGLVVVTTGVFGAGRPFPVEEKGRDSKGYLWSFTSLKIPKGHSSP